MAVILNIPNHITYLNFHSSSCAKNGQKVHGAHSELAEAAKNELKNYSNW